MQDIMNKVKDLYERLLVRWKKLEEVKENLARDRKKVDAEAEANAKFKEELDEREKPIKEIEDVVKLRDEVATEYRKLSSDKKLLKKGQSELEQDKKKFKEESKTEREEISASRQKLSKMEVELEKKKENYKREVMENINKLLADKGIQL